MASDDPAARIEVALNRIRRAQAERRLARTSVTSLRDAPADLRAMEVIFAVDEGPAEGPEVVSVGEVARRLGVDSSQGSRLVARAVSAGYLRRTAQQDDGRRSGLVLTDLGREIADAAHRRRQDYYLELMEGWSDGERRTLADLLTRLIEAMWAQASHRSRSPPP